MLKEQGAMRAEQEKKKQSASKQARRKESENIRH